MTRFSANLGFLWTDRSLIEAIHAAKAAGFDAVECHWPYDTPSGEVGAALAATGLQMLSLNTTRGDVAAGENGLAALPGREKEARGAIDAALAYGAAIGAGRVHVMAGRAWGDAAHEAFVDTLGYACERAAGRGIDILIEPLNPDDAPGYFLKTTGQACEIMDELGRDNLKLMFDCYHVERTEGATLARLEALLPRIGHIQIASVPDRGPPDHGALDYGAVFALLERSGWQAPLGAEYRPDGATEASLGWLARYRR